MAAQFCLTTFLAIAEGSRLEFKSFECNSSGKLDLVAGTHQMTEVILEPTLVILKDEDKEKAMRILTKTESACLITKSIKSKVVMKPVIKVVAGAVNPLNI